MSWSCGRLGPSTCSCVQQRSGAARPKLERAKDQTRESTPGASARIHPLLAHTSAFFPLSVPSPCAVSRRYRRACSSNVLRLQILRLSLSRFFRVWDGSRPRRIEPFDCIVPLLSSCRPTAAARPNHVTPFVATPKTHPDTTTLIRAPRHPAIPRPPSRDTLRRDRRLCFRLCKEEGDEEAEHSFCLSAVACKTRQTQSEGGQKELDQRRHHSLHSRWISGAYSMTAHRLHRLQASRLRCSRSTSRSTLRSTLRSSNSSSSPRFHRRPSRHTRSSRFGTTARPSHHPVVTSRSRTMAHITIWPRGLTPPRRPSKARMLVPTRAGRHLLRCNSSRPTTCDRRASAPGPHPRRIDKARLLLSAAWPATHSPRNNIPRAPCNGTSTPRATRTIETATPRRPLPWV